MLNNFIYAKTKDLFLKELEAGNVLDEAIVFIEDAKEIWNHGTYFDGKSIDISNIEESIQNIINNKAEKSELPTKTSDLTNDSGFITIEDIPTGSLLKTYTFEIDSNLDYLEYTITQEELEKIQNADIFYLFDGTGNIQLTVAKGDSDPITFQGYNLNLYPDNVSIFYVDVSTSLQVVIWCNIVVSDYILDYIDLTRPSDAIAMCDEIVDGAHIVIVKHVEAVTGLNNPRPITLILMDSYSNTVFLFGPYIQSSENTFLNKFIGEYNDLTIECVLDVSTFLYGTLHIKPKSEGGSSDANVQAVDTTEELDDVETNTYVKYVAQTLTDALKQQVRENIGVNSITESTIKNWGFTKNTGTYIKPSTGIPKTDLASAVQTSLAKADTALQTETYKGTVTGVKVNGTTKNPSNGVVDLGTVITSHQDISGKQDTLISGTNIKTINGNSLLGSGNITIESETQVQSDWNETDTTSAAYIANKPNIYMNDSGVLIVDSEIATGKEFRIINSELRLIQSNLRFSNSSYFSTNSVGLPRLVIEDMDNEYIDFVASGNGTKFLSDDGTYKTLYTTTEIDNKIGDINTVLESIING